MSNRCARSTKKEENYQVSMEPLIDRFKKVRALNCNPADVGLDCYVWNVFFTNSRSNALTKFL